jgi:hypothetical protein
MYDSGIVEYTNRNKMEETTGKVFARLHHMKSILCKTIKSKYIGNIRTKTIEECSFKKFENIALSCWRPIFR